MYCMRLAVLTAVFAIAAVVFPSAFAQDRGRERILRKGTL